MKIFLLVVKQFLKQKAEEIGGKLKEIVKPTLITIGALALGCVILFLVGLPWLLFKDFYIFKLKCISYGEPFLLQTCFAGLLHIVIVSIVLLVGELIYDFVKWIRSNWKEARNTVWLEQQKSKKKRGKRK